MHWIADLRRLSTIYLQCTFMLFLFIFSKVYATKITRNQRELRSTGVLPGWVRFRAFYAKDEFLFRIPHPSCICCPNDH